MPLVQSTDEMIAAGERVLIEQGYIQPGTEVVYSPATAHAWSHQPHEGRGLRRRLARPEAQATKGTSQRAAHLPGVRRIPDELLIELQPR